MFDASLREGIDPELAFRLVRLESEFNARAVSKTGAIGLTQLMPSTAVMFDKTATRDKLFVAEVNLKIGMHYLRTLLDMYKGDVRLALLAYNRGEDAVWRDVRAGVNPGQRVRPEVIGDYKGKGTNRVGRVSGPTIQPENAERGDFEKRTVSFGWLILAGHRLRAVSSCRRMRASSHCVLRRSRSLGVRRSTAATVMSAGVASRFDDGLAASCFVAPSAPRPHNDRLSREDDRPLEAIRPHQRRRRRVVLLRERPERLA